MATNKVVKCFQIRNAAFLSALRLDSPPFGRVPNFCKIKASNLRIFLPLVPP